MQAVFKAKSVGAKLTHWLMAPATAETLAKIKKASGSNESLISFDARGELSVLGLPVLTHPGVDAATFFWGIPADRVVTVLRKDAEVNRSKDSGFYNDALDVRAITRVGIGFLHPAAVIRGYDAA
ncbi:MAG: phage major capsid family protein [Mycobacteriaceae bacterium]